MRQNWFIAATLSLPMLALAQQQPKIINAQLQHSVGHRWTLRNSEHTAAFKWSGSWLGYAVAALPGSHFSMCSGNADSSADNGCCGVYRLEDSNHNFQSPDSDHTPQTSITVLVRLDHEAVDKVRFIGTACEPGRRRITVHLVDRCQGRRKRGVAVEPGEGRQQAAHGRSSGSNRDARNCNGYQCVGKLFLRLQNPSVAARRKRHSEELGAGRGHDGFLALKKMENDADPGSSRKKLSWICLSVMTLRLSTT